MLHYDGYHLNNGANVISCRWALAMQEYDFKIVHRKGFLNVNTDAPSHQNPLWAAILAMTYHYPLQVLTSQHANQAISKLPAAHSQASNTLLGHKWQTNHWDDMWKFETSSGFAMVYSIVGITSLIQCLRQSQSPSSQWACIIKQCFVTMMLQWQDTKAQARH